MGELTSPAESDRKIALDRYRILRSHLEDRRALSVVATGRRRRSSGPWQVDGHNCEPLGQPGDDRPVFHPVLREAMDEDDG